jgi:membrane protease YdiL (CAAX protease family)
LDNSEVLFVVWAFLFQAVLMEQKAMTDNTSLKSQEPQTSNGLWVYFALTYAISWVCWGVLIVFQIPAGSVNPDLPPPPIHGLLLLGLGILAPTIAAVILTWRLDGRAGLRDLWARCTRFYLGWRPYLVIFLLPLVVGVVRVAVHLLRSGVLLQPTILAQPALLIGFTIQIFVFGPLMEEAGWRGFALPRLLARRDPVSSSLILGAIHAIWHLPTYFTIGTIQQLQGNPIPEFIIFALTVTSAAVVVTWLYVSTGGSVWSAMTIHATQNFTSSLLWMLYEGDFVDRLVGLVVFAALGLAFIAIMPKERSHTASSVVSA